MNQNSREKNKLICGDAIIELEKLNDASIDIVITDPPYGIKYESNRSKNKNHIQRQSIKNNSLNDALNLFNKTIEILNRKMKPNSHLYVFTSWKVVRLFREMISNYFEINNIIVWDKKNHGAGDLYYSWGDRCEWIIFATKGNKSLNTFKGNILSFSKVHWSKRLHPNEKPINLIKELLEMSAKPKDIICDPFMGSGSTIKAIIEFRNLNYIGIEIDKKWFKLLSQINHNKPISVNYWLGRN